MAAQRTRIDLQSIFRLTELADYIIPFALRVVCDLGVADHLVDGPRSCNELAVETRAHAPSLYRVLRALACKGIFTEVEPGRFGLTPMAELLRSDHPLSLRGAYPLLRGDIEAFACFAHSIRTGEAAFDHAHGQRYWDYMAEHPDESIKLDGAQQAQTRLELRVVLRAYDWPGVTSIVDVGGGNGSFLAGLLRRNEALRGVLFDLPHVVAGADRILQREGVEQRCEIVGGSFFEGVPPGADAYILKRVLYGWDDDKAILLLRAVRDAMRSDSRLLVLEPIVGDGQETDMVNRYDLLMLAMNGSSARTRDQIERLFSKVGLCLERIITTLMFPIVEATRA